MPLHLDYRPTTLKEIAGEANASLVASLTAMLARPREKVPHAFLFTGQSGCGKTTLARIVATALGCSPRDFIELDSAQFRGIDTVRELRRTAQLSPMGGPCRVYLIDEVHGMTGAAQEALLKFVEDTPKHVWVCLATTEPEALKKTLVNRCNRHELKPLHVREMAQFLRGIAKKDGVEIAGDVLKELAKGADGSPRAGLTALESVLDLPAEKRLEAARAVSIGTDTQIKDLCQTLLAGGGWAKTRKILSGLQKEDAERIRRAVLAWSYKSLLRSDDVRAAILLEAFENPTWEMGGWPAIMLACYRATTMMEG